MLLHPLLSALIVASSLAPSQAQKPAPSQAKKPTPPPGMALIDGGRTQVGSELKWIEARILEDTEAGERATSLLSETPRHSVEVAPFYLMVNEVTNQQFEAYVKATGARPPEPWGAAAVEAARKAHVEEQGRLRQAARDKGETLGEPVSFDSQDWWKRNWKDAGWEIPKDRAGRSLALHPVTFVAYEDAQGYARWAGLRLMTEAEFQRAVRGDSDREYPWGSTWEPANVVFREGQRQTELQPIASRPAGASEAGVFDLVGNVWEWTATPFTSYPGYKPLELTLGSGSRKRTRKVEVPWDPDLRVIVGGSYQTSELTCRAAVRRRTERPQTTELLGFRCAASQRPGTDVARVALDVDLPARVRPETEEGRMQYKPEAALTLERWIVGASAPERAGAAPGGESAEGSDGAPLEAAAPVEGGAPPGYAVIEGHEHVTFVPAALVSAANAGDLREDSVQKALAPIGVLSTSLPLLEPALAPGTYMVSFRGAGARKHAPGAEKPADEGEEKTDEGKDEKGRKGDKPGKSGMTGAVQDPPAQETPPAKGGDVVADEPPTLEEQLALDIHQDNYVFFDNSGTPVASLPAAAWEFVRTSDGAVAIVDMEIVRVDESGVQTQSLEKRLKIEAVVESLVSAKAFRFTLPLKLEPEAFARDWR